MSRRSRRSGERSSTPAGVPRPRVWSSSWRSSGRLERPLQDTYPVDLSPFDSAEVLGTDISPVFNRKSHSLHPSPLAKRAFSNVRYSSTLGALARLARGDAFVIRSSKRVQFCVSRKQRRQVLFAQRIAGKRGVGRGKRWRRSSTSSWRC